MPSGLRLRYNEEIVPALMERLGYGNRMQVPHIEKVIVNIGVGEAIQNPSAL